jgi:hypothetical protein
MELDGVKLYDKLIEDRLLMLSLFESQTKEDFIASFEVMKYIKGVKIMSEEEMEKYYQEGYKKSINENIKEIQKMKEDYIESQKKKIKYYVKRCI